MAERRMFAKTIIDSDAFLEMPISSRLLYYDLAMRADDDGFNNAPIKVMRTVGATMDDLNILIARKFVIPFDNGVVVIKHWRIHNYIRKDTYNETPYKELKAQLEYDENKAYRKITDSEIPALDVSSTTRGRPVDEPSTQVRLGKDSIGKDSIEESVADKPPASTKQAKKSYGEFGWVKLTDDEFNRLLNDLGEAEVKRCIAYVDESAEMTKNKNKWREWNLVIRKCSREGWGLGYKRKAQQIPEPVDKIPGVTYL